MKADVKNVLYQKTGVTISNLALNLLSKNKGDRIPPISVYQEEFNVARGTIQNAFKYLKKIGAISLSHRGHLGTYIKHIDYIKLQENCLQSQILGIMPLPYSRTYEGFATAIYKQLDKIKFNMAYSRGAVGRINLVERGIYQFAIVSQYAAEYAISLGSNINIVMNFGEGSFLSKHVLLLKDKDKKGIEDNMKVAYDEDSLDQSIITKNIIKDKKVELVDIRVQQIISSILSGDIDAGVLNYDDVLENYHLDNINIVFLSQDEYSKLFSTAVLVTKKANTYLQEILNKNISINYTINILNQVKEGKLSPYF